MGITIGIFDKEQQVLDAVELLRASGAHKDDVRVIVKNEENVPLLSASDAIQVEGIAGIRAAREHFSGRRDGDAWDGDGDVPVAGVFAVPQLSGTGGFAGGVTNPGVAAPGLAVPGGGLLGLNGDGPHTDSLLADLGLSGGDTDRLAEAVNDGRYLVVVGERPDDQAGDLLSRAGALEIVN
ncbi:hypothetical protein [Cohnella sp. 56]|uniref:hypothetical protein n=1 Tax=Cohnella sp. 56 TaxID=3113722 RepID=UPI0030EACD0F